MTVEDASTREGLLSTPRGHIDEVDGCLSSLIIRIALDSWPWTVFEEERQKARIMMYLSVVL